MTRPKIRVRIISHHDPEDMDGGGDECGVSVFVNDMCVAQYGDYYHDKGREKAIGFVDALRSLGYDFEVERDSHMDARGWEHPDLKMYDLGEVLPFD